MGDINFWFVMAGFWVCVLAMIIITNQWVALGPTIGAIGASLAAGIRR